MKILIYITLFISYPVLSNDQNLITKGKANFGFAKDSGNIERQELKYGFELINELGKNTTIATLDSNISEKKDDRYKDEFELSLLDIYNFDKLSGIYGKITYYENPIIGYEQQLRFGVGYLNYWFQSGKNKYFKTRIGAQTRFSDYTTGDNDRRDYALVGYRAGFPLMTNISLKTELNYEINILDSHDYKLDGYIKSVFYVNKIFDVNILYKVNYSNEPVPGKKSTDTSLTTNLVYKF
jgi:putative salt-induced outer membrane protein YdiY